MCINFYALICPGSRRRILDLISFFGRGDEKNPWSGQDLHSAVMMNHVGGNFVKFKALFFCLFVASLQMSCSSNSKKTSDLGEKRKISSDSAATTLETPSLSYGEYRFFREAILNPGQMTFSQLVEKYDTLSQQSSELENVYRHYSSQVLKINNDDLETWMGDANNARLRRGIMYYIDDPGRMDVPYWMAINDKLRRGVPLTQDEVRVKNEILWSLERMPQISGVVFRGIKMTPERYENLKKLVGKEYVEPGFTSTSISPAAAERFGKVFPNDSDQNRVETLWIMKINRGGAVSIFHYDYNMFQEVEALIAPGATYRVTGHYADPNRTVYPRAVFLMEQVIR